MPLIIYLLFINIHIIIIYLLFIYVEPYENTIFVTFT